MKIISAVAGAALLVGVPTMGMSATILIDDFTNDTRVTDLPDNGTQNTEEFAAPTAIGGFRDLTVTTTGSAPASTDLRTTGDLGRLSFSNVSGAAGNGAVTYDGGDGDASEGGVDIDGLGSIDLTDGGTNDGFFFDVVDLDAALDFEFRIFDGGGGFSNLMTTVPESFEGQTAFAPFALFEGDADLTNVGALQFAVEGPIDSDGAIDRITVAPIPVPASLLLLGGGLAGLGALRRRKKS